MKVSAVQFAATTNVTANVETITRLVGSAAEAWSSASGEAGHLVVLPEASMHDIGSADLALGPVAQAVDGPFVSALGRLARQYQVTIVAGMFESVDGSDRPYNTVVAVGSDGGLLTRYRKLHLYDSFGYRESDRLTPGDGELGCFQLEGLTFGVQTCYDVRFPELSRALVDRGVDVLVVPAAWVRGPLKERHWQTLLAARAIENTCYVVGAGQCGRSYIGCSAVLDPMGVVVAALGPDEGIASADLRGSAVQQAREVNPSLANRRM